MAQHNALGTRELWVSDKFSLMPAVTPTAAQTGWAITNQTGNNRTHDCNSALADVLDTFGQLVADLIAKGIISA